MNIQLRNGDFAAVNFFNGCRVNLRSSGTVYSVQWFFNDVFFGDMNLGNSMWGCYGTTEFGIWRLKFYQEQELVLDYINDLRDKDCLLMAQFNAITQVGKKKDISSLTHYANDVVEKYGCNLKVYFPKTWEYDFSSYKFSPLRLNDGIDNIYFGIDKEF